jgi:hypothetical protein
MTSWRLAPPMVSITPSRRHEAALWCRFPCQRALERQCHRSGPTGKDRLPDLLAGDLLMTVTWPSGSMMPSNNVLHCCAALPQVGKKAKEAGAAASAASKKAGRAAKAAARDPQVSIYPMHLHLTEAQTHPAPHSWGGTRQDSWPQSA